MTGPALASVASDSKYLGCHLPEDELACLAEQFEWGAPEVKAVADTFSYLAARKREKTAAMALNMSRIPQKSPKTFEGFDFSRLQGKGGEALALLPRLTNLYARKNLAFIGPEGVGKTHLAQAYGREVCMQGMRSYYIKASELRDKLDKAVKAGTGSSVVNLLVNPHCLIIDEVGRCTFDKACTDLFFHIVDRRCDKECPNLTILTSNYGPDSWGEYFTGDSTLLCTLDRLFDNASVFMMKGQSFRGSGLETFAVEAVPSVMKVPAR